MVLVTAWYKVQYNFEVVEFDGPRDYRDDRIRAYVPSLIDQGVSPFPEVTDVSYAANYGWYYVGVANKGYFNTESSPTFVQTSTQYIAHRQEVVDAISDPDFSPYLAQGGSISVTLTDDSARSSFTMSDIGYRWFYGTVDIIDEDGDGQDDRGQRENCPGQQGAEDRRQEIEKEFADAQAKYDQASENLHAAKRYLDAATDYEDYAELSQYVNSATDAARKFLDVVAPISPHARLITRLVDVFEIVYTKGGSLNAVDAAEIVKKAVVASLRSTLPMVDDITKVIVEPSLRAADLGLAAYDARERQAMLNEARNDVARAQNMVDDQQAAQRDAQQRKEDLFNELRDLVDCDQWSSSPSIAAASAQASAAGPLVREYGDVGAIISDGQFSGRVNALVSASVKTLFAEFGVADDRIVFADERDLEIYAGDGVDTAIVTLNIAQISDSAAIGDDVFITFKNGSLVALGNFENVRASDGIFVKDQDFGYWKLKGSANADRLEGSGGTDKIFGMAGDDILIGGAGYDTIDGGAGADEMSGGAGNDVYYVDDRRDVILEIKDEGFDQVFTSVNFNLTGKQVEMMTLTGNAALFATGNSLNNVLIGNAGDNVLSGLGGNDYLDGGRGRDRMIGGAGNDLYVVDHVGDQVVEVGGEGIDEVRTGRPAYALDANVENLRGTASTGQRLIGNSLANMIVGGDGDDLIRGLHGRDILSGGGGKDSFWFDTALGISNRDQIIDFEVGLDQIALSSSIFSTVGAIGELSSSAFRLGTIATNADQRIIYDQDRGYVYYDPDGNGQAAREMFAMVTPGLALTASDFMVVG